MEVIVSREKNGKSLRVVSIHRDRRVIGLGRVRAAGVLVRLENEFRLGARLRMQTCAKRMSEAFEMDENPSRSYPTEANYNPKPMNGNNP